MRKEANVWIGRVADPEYVSIHLKLNNLLLISVV